MSNKFIEKFEGGMTKLAASLAKLRSERKRDKILLRIDRLQKQSHEVTLKEIILAVKCGQRPLHLTT